MLTSIFPVHCPTPGREGHISTLAVPHPRRLILYTTLRFRVQPTVGSKTTFKFELKLKRCPKCSAQDQDLQSIARVTGVRLTAYPHWMEDKRGLVLELLSDPQVLPRSEGGVFSPALNTQPCNSRWGVLRVLDGSPCSTQPTGHEKTLGLASRRLCLIAQTSEQSKLMC